MKDFGATGDGSTDDTTAICTAVSAAVTSGQTVIEPVINLSSIPIVQFPSGVYKMTGGCTSTSNISLVGQDAIITQSTATPTFTVTARTFLVSGIKFSGGATALVFTNNNVDASLFRMDHVVFNNISSWPVKVIPTAPALHLSAQVVCDQCQWLYTGLGMLTYADHTTISKSWIEWGGSAVLADTAFFQTNGGDTGTTGGGYLYLDDCLLVPAMGLGIAKVRWVDNYGSFAAYRTRFSGEDAGIPTVYNFVGFDNSDPFSGSSIQIRDSEVSDGAASRPDSGVVVLQTGVPDLIVLDGDRNITDSPYIRNVGIVNLKTYLDGASSPLQAFQFQLGILSPANFPYSSFGGLYPLELSPFMKINYDGKLYAMPVLNAALNGSANQNSNSLVFDASYGNGSALALDTYTLTNNCANGTSPDCTLSLASSGSPGNHVFAYGAFTVSSTGVGNFGSLIQQSANGGMTFASNNNSAYVSGSRDNECLASFGFVSGVTFAHLIDICEGQSGAFLGYLSIKINSGGGFPEVMHIDSNGNVTFPSLKSLTGTRFICADTTGKLVSSASACSGT